MMKRLIKSHLPHFLIQGIRSIKHRIAEKRNSKRSARSVFQDIYRKGEWGTKSGDFFSGVGSADNQYAKKYIDMMIACLETQGGKRSVVDLGCGDLNISKHFFSYCSRYTGVDVVPELIEKHSSSGFGDHIRFMCLDITEDDLPEGDICLIRQVFQHLSNNQILTILKKLKKYSVCFITEHYPSDNPGIVPNKDMVQGSWVRVYENSGVYLDHPPFNISTQKLQLVLETPGVGIMEGYDTGIIRTFRMIL
jgi:SAM-dependent methyltransferase